MKLMWVFDLGDVATNQKVISWFWETVREFEQEQKAKLLQFVTGMFID